MAFTETEICNMALAHVGVTSSITNIDDASNTTPAAVNCRLFYDVCRKSMLEMARWPFAATTVSLTDTGDAPTNWIYRYKYPTDAIRANFIVNPTTKTPQYDEKIPFQIVNFSDGSNYGKAILCDAADAELDYNQNITDVSLFDNLFCFALSYYIATNIAIPLRVDPELLKLARENFQILISEALSHGLRESQEDVHPESQFYYARY